MVAGGEQEGLETDTWPLQSSEIFLLFDLNFLITPDEESHRKKNEGHSVSFFLERRSCFGCSPKVHAIVLGFERFTFS